jgi:hypothetical protein
MRVLTVPSSGQVASLLDSLIFRETSNSGPQAGQRNA